MFGSHTREQRNENYTYAAEHSYTDATGKVWSDDIEEQEQVD